MSSVFRINEELSSITVTATELLSICKSFSSTVKNEEFTELFNSIVSEVNQCYGVVTGSFAPFFELDCEQSFIEEFDQRHQTFRDNYLLDVSKPRKYCDNVYDSYIQLQHTKEAKSSYPALKRNFQRLDKLYDKWISNDNFLGLSIDAVLKQKNLLLTQIAELKKKDAEESWQVFYQSFDDFCPYLNFISGKSREIANIVNEEAA